MTRRIRVIVAALAISVLAPSVSSACFCFFPVPIPLPVPVPMPVGIGGCWNPFQPHGCYGYGHNGCGYGVQGPAAYGAAVPFPPPAYAYRRPMMRPMMARAAYAPSYMPQTAVRFLPRNSPYARPQIPVYAANNQFSVVAMPSVTHPTMQTATLPSISVSDSVPMQSGPSFPTTGGTIIQDVPTTVSAPRSHEVVVSDEPVSSTGKYDDWVEVQPESSIVPQPRTEAEDIRAQSYEPRRYHRRSKSGLFSPVRRGSSISRVRYTRR